MKKISKVLPILTILFVLGLPLVDAQSATATQTLTIEKAEELLVRNKKKKNPIWARIQKAIEKKNYSHALTFLKKIKKNKTFVDYYHFLTGKVEFLRMHQFRKKKQWQNAISAGERAFYHLSQVPSVNVQTPFEKKAAILSAQVKLHTADIHYRLKRKSKAMAFYEDAFERMGALNLSSLITTDAAIHYFSLCERKPTEICTGWELKLLSLLSRPLSSDPRAEKLTARVKALKITPPERETSVRYRVEADLEMFDKGFEQYLNGKYAEAFVAWEDLLEEYPRTNIRYRTKFWMARAAQKSNHEVQAETLYREIIQHLPFSYYGLLSSKFSGIKLSRMISGELPMASTDSVALSPVDLTRLRRAEALIASGASELAAQELRQMGSRDKLSNEFLVYLAMLNHKAKNHWTVFHIFSELSNRNFNGLFSAYGQKLYFPTTYLPLVKRITKNLKVDPLLILSIIKQESAFHAEVVSWANAFGLMQIIPPTARDLDPDLNVSELWIPERNVELGAKYINRLLERFKGNLVLALAGYNAGPSNAERWRRNIKSAESPEEFIEQITFRETREYVSSIIRNYYWYNRRLRDKAVLTFEIPELYNSKK